MRRPHETTVKEELITLNDELESLLELSSEIGEINRETLRALEKLGDDAAVENAHLRASVERLGTSIENSTDRISASLKDLGGDIVGGAVVRGALGFLGLTALAHSAAINAILTNPDFILFQKTIRMLNLLREFEPIPIADMQKKLLYRGWLKQDSRYLLPGLIDRRFCRTYRSKGIDYIEINYYSRVYQNFVSNLEEIRELLPSSR